MKRVLSIAVVCIVLFTLSGVSAFAKGGVPDVTPPVVYAVGISPTTDPMKGCPGNAPVMVQGKVTDLGGVNYVKATTKSPLGAVADWPMSLAPDGYWRAWIPKAIFTLKGTWYIRVQAYDYNNNTTQSGWKALIITDCDRTAPTVGEPTWTPNEIVGKNCAGPRTALVQTTAWDASGIKKVELHYLAPGAVNWSIINMSRYSNNGYQATIGNFVNGQVEIFVKAFDPYNHVSSSQHYFITVQKCDL